MDKKTPANCSSFCISSFSAKALVVVENFALRIVRPVGIDVQKDGKWLEVRRFPGLG